MCREDDECLGVHTPVSLLQVNDELKMGKGKIGAQCAHAAVGAVELATLRAPHALDAWESRGQAKICLRADSTAALVRPQGVRGVSGA